MPDNMSSEKEMYMKQLKRAMECWREVVLPLNSILLWEKLWYPALILGLTTTIFCMIWMLEPALLTLISLSLLILALVDYFVPTIIPIFCTADSWTGQKEKKLNEICHNISEAILQFQSSWRYIINMRYSRPNFYYGTIMVFLMLFAWLGNTINNLLLSYIAVLRLGRCLDSFYLVLSTMRYPDLIVRITLTLSKIANALFLLADHIIWLGRVGIFRVDIEKWSKVSNKYWLMNVILNLTRDVYEIVKIYEQEKFHSSKKISTILKCKSVDQYKALLCLKDHKDIVMDTIKNGCDLFIPLTALGYTKLTPGIIGICGFVSSMLGIYTLIHPLYKLKPS
ncbi:hypothetical protein M0802_010087 [Mischocyttarus mexicanus]|nr:hypothetical protein M0802_010087 [Mischocyttarus mexicanus]